MKIVLFFSQFHGFDFTSLRPSEITHLAQCCESILTGNIDKYVYVFPQCLNLWNNNKFTGLSGFSGSNLLHNSPSPSNLATVNAGFLLFLGQGLAMQSYGTYNLITNSSGIKGVYYHTQCFVPIFSFLDI